MPTLQFSPDVDANKLQRRLGITNYTVENVLQLFHANCADFSSALNDNRVEKIEVEEIGQGKGYCSQIYKIHISFPTNGASAHSQRTFIAKVSSDEQWSEMKEDFTEEERARNKQHVIRMHNCECAIYELFRRFKELPVPKSFYTEQADHMCSGIILMEDVSTLGDSASVFESVTPGQCFNVARMWAYMQAQLNFVEDQTWRTRFDHNAQATKNVYCVTKGLIESALDFDDPKLTDYIETYHKMDLQKLARFAMEEYTAKYDANTLCHSDVWTNNMLMRFNEDGSISDEVVSIIDWQIACVANPLYDLCSFIVLCASPEVRRDCEQKAIDLYYEELCRHYADHDAKPKFSREQAHEFYDIAFVQLIVSLIMQCAVHALPLKDSKDPEEKAKCRALVRRLRAAFDDIQPTLEKHRIVERFTLKREIKC